VDGAGQLLHLDAARAQHAVGRRLGHAQQRGEQVQRSDRAGTKRAGEPAGGGFGLLQGGRRLGGVAGAQPDPGAIDAVGGEQPLGGAAEVGERGEQVRGSESFAAGASQRPGVSPYVERVFGSAYHPHPHEFRAPTPRRISGRICHAPARRGKLPARIFSALARAAPAG
jgi:hypothetical protein